MRKTDTIEAEFRIVQSTIRRCREEEKNLLKNIEQCRKKLQDHQHDPDMDMEMTHFLLEQCILELEEIKKELKWYRDLRDRAYGMYINMA